MEAEDRADVIQRVIRQAFRDLFDLGLTREQIEAGVRGLLDSMEEDE